MSLGQWTRSQTQAGLGKGDSSRFIDAEAREWRRVDVEIDEVAIRIVGYAVDVRLFSRTYVTRRIVAYVRRHSQMIITQFVDGFC